MDTGTLPDPAADAPGTDLTRAAGHWLTRRVIAWAPPRLSDRWSYRLHVAPSGGLDLGAIEDDRAVERTGSTTRPTGGATAVRTTAIPLTPTPDGLPPALRERHPHLAGLDAFRLDHRATDRVEDLLTGQLAVAAYDRHGRLRAATGLQLGGVLDDVYPGAVDRDLGVTWDSGTPTLRVWAPTAKHVNVAIQLAADAASPEATPRHHDTTSRIALQRDDDGVWSVDGDPTWHNAAYAYEITVWMPAERAVVTNVVTDPYSVALTTDSHRSIVADLDHPALKPDGWDDGNPPTLAHPVDQSIYELHIRDFSIGDVSVPPVHRGTYLAFTHLDSDGMRHLRALADAGLTTVHLLPTHDMATVPDRSRDQLEPPCDLTRHGPASTAQQACIARVADEDGFNWGYDPWHYSTPEGSYSTAPDGTARTLEYRRMVQALNGIGLRVVADVVYNHTSAHGSHPQSVLDRVVPGYYHRRHPATGEVETSTCCPNTASERRMMEKLMVDSVVTWARDYRINGFRFDLMGHHSLANMRAVRAALDALAVPVDGIDGAQIHLYGEGWNFGEVADDARFTQARQQHLAGTGIGSFNDRLRDALRGGRPRDSDPRRQGFGTGLFTEPNRAGADRNAVQQERRLLYLQDQIKIGLAGNLRDFRFVDRNGVEVSGGELNGTGYAATPAETVNYVDAHDDETLFDIMILKMHPEAATADRARMSTVCQAIVALSQGVAFWHAGTDLLRSKSLDRNSYNSGDWFNRIDWSCGDNAFGSGLPPESENGARWSLLAPLLERADTLRPSRDDMVAARGRARDLLRLRYSSPLFRLGDAALIQQRVVFPHGGPEQPRGLITMVLDDTVGDRLDPRWDRIVVVFNATPRTQTVPIDGGAAGFRLHPVQRTGSDDVVRRTAVAQADVDVPGRTAAVLVRSRSAR